MTPTDQISIMIEASLIPDDPPDTVETTWGEFCEANADGIDTEEMAAIARDLDAGRSYRSGGGASPVWTVSKATTP